MSFLTEVMSSAAKTDIESIKTNLPVISEKIQLCQEEINTYIENVYRKFSEWPAKNQQLLTRTTQLSTDIQDIQGRIEQVAVKEVGNKVDEVGSLAVDLDRSNIALGIVLRLIQIHQGLITVQELRKKMLYVKAGLELVQVDEFINGIPEDEVTLGVNSLMMSVAKEKTVLGKKLMDVFEEELVKVTQGTPGNVTVHSVKISNKFKEVADVLAVLATFDQVDRVLQKFSKFFYRFICEPIVNSITSIKLEDDGLFTTLTLSSKNTTAKIPYKEVFSKLIDVFTFLHTHFNHRTSDGDLKTVVYIGAELKQDLSDVILNECLIDTLPPDDEHCNLYKSMIEDMKEFQKHLVELEVLDEGANPILGYANDMDLLFINKKCQEYLSASIFFMKKDLHDLVDVGVPHDEGNPLKAGEFPESSVSRSTIEILDLAQKVLEQAACEDERSAARMLCTVQSIFYQYGNISHGHHEKLLNTIPQQVALFRNNCMYIAHELAQLNNVHTKKFPRAVLPSPPIFTDQPHQLRSMGGEIFLAYVETQNETMENLLKEYHFNTASIAGVLHADLDKCLRQCIRQHELLKTVWLKVLPHSFYNKTMGYLLNSFCRKLVDLVIAAEDIPAKNAEQLVEMYRVVLTRGPRLFLDPQEISLFVETWQKLIDLVFVLGANLVAINDRWADGKGPLTLHFKPEEVRSLIKALFQNTDRRAAVVNRIR